jgi:hypothetical protein
MRGPAIGVALGLALAVVIACNRRPPPPPPQQPNEILSLWTQIREWRREAGLALEPRVEWVMQTKGKTVQQARRVCAEGDPIPETCHDICNLGDAICDNAERICELADELGKDNAWAQDKCASAKASCREAKQRCCQCSKDGA